MGHDNLQIVEAYFANLTATEPYLADDVEFIDIPTGTALRGISNVADMTRSYYTEMFTGACAGIEHIVATEDCVVSEYTFHGINTGSLMGGPPTGRTVQIPTTLVFELENGKIAKLRVYYDLATLAYQLGDESKAPSYRNHRPSVEQINEDSIRKGFAAALSSEWEIFADYCAEDYVDHTPPPIPGLPSGIQGVRASFEWLMSLFDGLQFRIEQIVAQGDTVVVRSSMTGRHTGSFLGMPATGNQINVPTVDLFKMKDGMAVEHWGVQDNLVLLTQLGIVPEMVPAAPQMVPQRVKAPS